MIQNYTEEDEWGVRKCGVLHFGSSCGLTTVLIQEGLAVASIARDDPSTLPGDDLFPRARPHAPRLQCAVNWNRNLKPKLAAPMHFRHRETDRQTDTDIVA